MKSISHPVVKDVVLIGAGHAHVQVLKAFGMRPLPGVRFTVITREVHTPYSGMLPGLIAGHYDFDDAHIDMGPLTRFANARLYQSSATGIDLAGKAVICDNRPPVPYDILSINTGSTPNTGLTPGAADHAIPVKPIDGFLARFEAMRERVLRREGASHIALIGGGAGGVELLLSLEHRLRRNATTAGQNPDRLSFTLISAAPSILPDFPAAFQQRFRKILAERGIEIVTGATVSRVADGALHFADRAPIAADEILWTTQAQPPDWLKATGLPLSDAGFIAVDATLCARGHDDIFAAGDIIAFGPRPLPKSGVYSVRAGPVLAENIRRRLTGRALTRYRPQRDAMYLISTGEEYAVGTRNGLTFAGERVWRWKDWIDRRFMRKFNQLPEMVPHDQPAVSPLADRAALDELAATPMRCGGCGAKVGATVLSGVLGHIEPVQRPDVLIGLDAPDDAAITDLGGDRLAVQTVDYFRAIIDDPYIFGKIAATHALGDIYAMGAEPQSALAIATVPYGVEAKVEAELTAMMIGANEVLREAECALAGGHTSEGAELGLGFAVTGLALRSGQLRKAGLKPGDAIILTKPLGTGTLLAAHMRGKAKARWIMAALAHMIQPNRAAARILLDHGAHAATDVTGFGLIGHLHEMMRASRVDTELRIGGIPVLDGARETLAEGIFSSLQPQNIRLRRAIQHDEAAASHPLYALLFDPQTAGGLLAGLAPDRADECVSALRNAGYAGAAIIGTVGPQIGNMPSIKLSQGGAVSG